MSADTRKYSFEFFPPKTPEGAAKLRETVRQLAQFNPAFFSVTFGAGGSTQEGLPFLAMEYVEGIRIDEYCRDRNLPVAARLELFRKVCSAVGYAHKNLVVHRDIKPSNILVTTDGTAKLLDFGIAKLLTTDSSITDTRPGMRPMTLDYASPEQATGGAITTATDIYSLGVLLYKLLTGRFPYGDKTNAAELHDAIRQQPAIPPSTIDAHLAGELDAIILKTLRKEPSERYPSVEHLSEDLARYLDGRAVLAFGDAVPYRAKKLLQRNWKAAVTAGVVAIMLVGGVVWAATYARRVGQERTKAEQEFSTARAAAERQQTELSTTYLKLAAMQATQEDHNGVLATYRTALEGSRRFALAYPASAVGMVSVARFAMRAGEAAITLNLNTEAQAAYREASARYQDLGKSGFAFEPSDLRDQVVLSRRTGLEQYQAKDFISALNPQSLVVVPNAYVEPSTTNDEPGSRYQFERTGYFVHDAAASSEGGRPVYNRTVTLRDSWGK